MAREVTLYTYKNKKGEERMGCLMSYAFAMRIASGDRDAIDYVQTQITNRVEIEEAKAVEEDDA